MGSAFAPAIGGAGAWSLAVLDAAGNTIYADRADRAATPASVLKLVVAATALDVLGPQYRFHTLMASHGGIGGGGAIDGNLWLVGSGDPSFRSGDLQRGVASLVRAGLTKVAGNVAVDATGMRGPEVNPHWDPDDAAEDYGAPTSAVSLDGDTVEFDVKGTTPGAPADVRVIPATDAIVTTGAITTSGAGSDSTVVIAPVEARNHFRLEGSIAEGELEKYWLPVSGVPQYVGTVLERMLRDAGVAVGGTTVLAPAPIDTAVVWDHRSAPLRALEAHMLFLSDNHYAEQLLRATGGEIAGVADDASGIATERQFLSRRGIPTPGLELRDGSGLSSDDRIAAITLARILADAEAHGGDRSLYLLLPLGGRQGTLKHYDFIDALGRVRAKSGHIGGVSALAGYVNTVHHGRIAFAFLIDGSPGDPDAAIVRAVNRLADF